MTTTLLEQELREQPATIARLLAEGHAAAHAVADAVRAFDPAFVMIAARGTSDNAARYAQYLLGAHVRLPVALATPSLHTLYDAPPNLARAWVIGISQSGQADDVRRVVEDANAQGALTLSITNEEASPLALAAQHHLPLRAGPERSVAATKTYTAQLTVLAQLAAALAPGDALAHALPTLPAHVQATLDGALTTVPTWAARYRYAEHIVVLGRGYNYSTAFEVSLKIKELGSIVGEAYSEADFRHGPIAILRRGFPVLVVAPSGAALPRMHDLLHDLHARGAELLVISDDATALAAAASPMPLPAVPEPLSPVCAVLPGQVLAMHLALARGVSVDKPHGLNKVTVTE